MCGVAEILTPRVCAVISEQPTEDEYAQGLRKQQMVMEFDMATWRVRAAVHSSLTYG